MNHSSAHSPAAIKVALVHLGCARNLIDSETILGRLGAEGYLLTSVLEGADVAVLNTCSFIGPARRESELAIERLLGAKERGEVRGVVVVGCLPQKFREDVERSYPAVDAFLGLSDYAGIAQVVESVLRGRKVRSDRGGSRFLGQAEGPRLLQTPGSYAYLRPSHGCDHACAFCIIPEIRGPQRSKPIETVTDEARQLVQRGVRELVLVAEDSTGYGTDLGGNGPRLPDLVEALARVPDLLWLRVMYAFPNAFPWRLTEVMQNYASVVPYLDIPMQHIATPVLKRMRRGGTRASVESILHRLRDEVPGITLRTTVLVGHPGEGRAEFEELVEFLKTARFERLGAFSFSPEAGTPAGTDPERCSTEEAQERLQEVMEVQARIHAEHQERRVGQELAVLIDGHTDQGAVGRTAQDAPEVDAVVHVATKGTSLEVGDLIEVRVTSRDDYDLHGTVVDAGARRKGAPS